MSSLWNFPGTTLHRILHPPEVKEVDEASIDLVQSVKHGSHGMDFSKPVSEPVKDAWHSSIDMLHFHGSCYDYCISKQWRAEFFVA